MDIFVKSFSDYRIIKHAKASSSTLILDSLEPESSTVTVADTNIDQSDAGNWLIADGVVFLIADVKPDKDKVTLTISPPLTAFSRPLELETQPSGQTIGGFMQSLLHRHWISCDDPVYAVPYLAVSSSDTTAYVPPELDASGCFKLPEYAALMRKAYRTVVRFSDAGHTLACSVSTAAIPPRQISFEDGRSQLSTATFSYSGLAKITALQDVDTGEKDADGNAILRRERSDWYLDETGGISQLIPQNRASGEWGVVHIQGDADVRTKVVEAFAKNKANHKVEFWSVLDLEVQTECTFLIYGRLFRSYISYKRKSSTDNRFFYKFGELATTATEKLKGVRL